ncbi:MLP-like protein 43 [Rosa chinensis]|uniref:MLP-like protein 43 n=1 Tax=Rosa chinensis TaxID=74649 RepID=UPI001AD8EFF0|nr:MLP-like protein 43 [Rosa chinensis]
MSPMPHLIMYTTLQYMKMELLRHEANKRMSLTALEAHVLEQYRSYKIIFQVTPKSDEGGNQVKITLEYEKLNESDQPPHKYLHFLVNVIKDIDEHLIAS